jgi:hypothetical protein
MLPASRLFTYLSRQLVAKPTNGVRIAGDSLAYQDTRAYAFDRQSSRLPGDGSPRSKTTHIINTDTGELIGRKDAYLPENMWLDDKGAAAELAHWKAQAAERRERDRKFAEEIERNARGYDVKVTLGTFG